jgi:hypothetical protein
MNFARAIVADATHPDTKAWLLFSLDSSNYVIRSYTPGATYPGWSATEVYVTGNRVTYAGQVYRSLQDGNQGNTPDVGPWWELALAEFGDPTPVPTADSGADWMVVGADGRLYVTATGGNMIDALDITTDPATVAAEYHVPADIGCRSPTYITTGPGSKLYFAAEDPADGNSICSMTTGAVFAKVGSVTGPRAFAINPSGEIWSRSWDFSTGFLTGIFRVPASGPGYFMQTPGGDFLFPANVGWFGGKWWAVNNGGLYQFTP